MIPVNPNLRQLGDDAGELAALGATVILEHEFRSQPRLTPLLLKAPGRPPSIAVRRLLQHGDVVLIGLGIDFALHPLSYMSQDQVHAAMLTAVERHVAHLRHLKEPCWNSDT